MSRGRWCRICDRYRPNEKFSGRGHSRCICKECQRRPKAERDRIDTERELYGYLRQSYISKKNIARLEKLAGHEDEQIRVWSQPVLDMARLYPGRRNRWRKLAKDHFDVFKRFRQAFGIWDDQSEWLDWLWSSGAEHLLDGSEFITDELTPAMAGPENAPTGKTPQPDEEIPF